VLLGAGGNHATSVAADARSTHKEGLARLGYEIPVYSLDKNANYRLLSLFQHCVYLLLHKIMNPEASFSL
jgi:hypothetical protein